MFEIEIFFKKLDRLFHFLLYTVDYCSCLLQENPLEKVKKIDCALLPPCKRSLCMKLRRSQYVTILRKHASSAAPGHHLTPSDYDCIIGNEVLQAHWFNGPAIPSNLFKDNKEGNLNEIKATLDEQEASEADISDQESWSKDSSDDSDFLE